MQLAGLVTCKREWFQSVASSMERARRNELTKVDIVIVNWNAGPQLRECIDSIFAHERARLGRVIIVDNASADGSANFCAEDDRVRLVQLDRNLGFGSACNLGALEGTSDYVLFLNPDTRFLMPTLGDVASFMDSPSAWNIGVCGVRMVGTDGATAKHCARIPAPLVFFNVSTGLSKLAPNIFLPLELLEFDHETSSAVPHVMGAFYFVRREVFEKVRGFDERFFVYYEDLDLSLRIADAGYTIYYMTEPHVFHRTGGTSKTAKAKALSYLFESRLTYAEKHYSRVGRALVAAGVYVVDPARRLFHSLISRSAGVAAETLKASFRLWVMRFGGKPDRS